MRVLVDGAIFRRKPCGGIARYWEGVLSALALMRKTVRLDVVLPPGAQPLPGIRCRTAGRPPAYWAAWRAELFHSTYYTSWPRMRCPSVATVYDFIGLSFPHLQPNGPGFAARQLQVLRQASAVVAISNATRALAQSMAGVEADRLFTAYPAVADVFAGAPPGAPEIRAFRRNLTGGAPYLLHVGLRGGYKNFRTVLEAFCRIAGKTDRHLVVAGGEAGLAEGGLREVSAAGAGKRIHVVRQVDDPWLRLAYAGADAKVQASLMEGFGIPVIEALACGTGLMLSDIPVYREIADGLAVFLPATDVDAWAEALLQPAAVPAGGRAAVLQWYTWEAAARVHVAAYEKALS